MPNLRELRGRIKSVQNIQKITQAMKLVAAARQKKAQDRVIAARPYAEKMSEVIHALAASTGGNPRAVFADSKVFTPASREAEELLTRREVRRRGLLVVSGERGLAGSFNANILRRAMESIGKTPQDLITVATVGKKASIFFQKRGYHIVQSEAMPTSGVPFSLAVSLGAAMRRLYANHEVDSVEIVYSRSLSAMSQRPTVQMLLPIEIEEDAGARGPTAEYIFEPSAPELLSALLPRYVDTLIYQALLEANAGEYGARMVAMSSATDNARDFVKSLTLATNRLRQAGITTEILEVVGGAEALRG